MSITTSSTLHHLVGGREQTAFEIFLIHACLETRLLFIPLDWTPANSGTLKILSLKIDQVGLSPSLIFLEDVGWHDYLRHCNVRRLERISESS